MDEFIPTRAELETCSRVARRVASKWALVDAEDLSQDLVLWLLTHPKQVTRFRTFAKPEATLVLTLKREGIRLCVKETSKRLGRAIEAEES
jgi:DNA-directed RNA polymerase specialized sigma24 family protein